MINNYATLDEAFGIIKTTENDCYKNKPPKNNRVNCNEKKTIFFSIFH